MRSEDTAVQYVLGELRPDEAAAFERQMAADADLADEVRRLQSTLGLLPYAAVAEPPPHLRNRVLAATAAKIRERTASAAPTTPTAPPTASTAAAPVPPTPARLTPLPARPAPRVVWSQFAAAIAATIAVVFGIDGYRMRQRLAEHEQVAQLLLEPNVVRSFAFAGGGGVGTVALDLDAKRGAIVLRDLPELPAGQVFRMWAEVGDRAVFCSDFRAGKNGTVTIQFRVPVEEYTTPPRKLFVTIEPAGQPTAPTGRRVMESV